MILELAGKRLADSCLAYIQVCRRSLRSITLADRLPVSPIGWPCWPEIVAISSRISLPALANPEITVQEFTPFLYQLLEEQRIGPQRSGEVLGFFRGFCRQFFRDISSNPDLPLAPCASPESSTDGLLNFNDILLILIESEFVENAFREPGELPLLESIDLVQMLIRSIHAMSLEERLKPDLLLGGFSSDACVIRRRHLSHVLDCELEVVDSLMPILSALRRVHRYAVITR